MQCRYHDIPIFASDITRESNRTKGKRVDEATVEFPIKVLSFWIFSSSTKPAKEGISSENSSIQWKWGVRSSGNMKICVAPGILNGPWSMCIYTIESYSEDIFVVILTVCYDNAASLIAMRIKYDGLAEKGWFCVR